MSRAPARPLKTHSRPKGFQTADHGGIAGRQPPGRSCAMAETRGGIWILAATILGSSLVFIDSSVVNVALPAIQRDLGADLGELQWVVEAYALALASLLLVGGAISDRIGRRKVFVAGAI